ncbi:helix-turn-helix domain-containing protein [Collinsella tanakaei]|uniref:helix-turn-helix domain-containing protein n=1 Tax=Collinsella tanakaei TaxID=626935 RepID=UPI00195B0DBD|nr:helix-turn-helix domain-containing protein [Collinsella tanakaei]MBM6867985.1 helix-turn-helix domain-containing protein [Collinsella tanakaei]
MSTYLTAETIRTLREARGLTQRDIAERIGVTDKAVSKWESGRGLPDISLVEPLAGALGVSIAELLTGDVRANANRAGNMLRSRFYVCPLCGNVIHALGEGSFSCCGVTLLPQEAEDAAEDPGHAVHVERIENDWYLTLDHPMTKDHFISFAAYVTSERTTLVKLYPEQTMEVRFPMRGSGYLYIYCNRHGLFRLRTPRVERRAGQLPVL